LPGGSINYKWDSTRGTETNQSKNPYLKRTVDKQKSEIGNHRAVTIMCIIPKILEKVVYK